MYGYSPDMPVRFSNFTLITPGVGTHSRTVSYPYGECRVLSAAKAITQYQFSRCQKLCGFKVCPRLLHMTSASGIEPHVQTK